MIKKQQRALRAVFRGLGNAVYADPSNPNNTVTVNFNTQPKNAGDTKVTNVRTEIHSLRPNTPVTDPSCTDPCKVQSRTENLSARLIISGSIENKTEVQQLLKDLAYNANSILNDTASGFPPGDDLVIDLGVA